MVACAAMFSGLGVALGAFGAHALRSTLEGNGQMENWKTAVTYQLAHGVALLALAVWARVEPEIGSRRLVRWTVGAWMVGIIGFSGSLYALGLGVPARMIWPVTPFGGLCLLAGWLLLGIAAVLGKSSTPDPTT